MITVYGIKTYINIHFREVKNIDKQKLQNRNEKQTVPNIFRIKIRKKKTCNVFFGTKNRRFHRLNVLYRGVV